MPKFKIKGRKESWQEAGTMLSENEDATVKRAKIKIPSMSRKAETGVLTDEDVKRMSGKKKQGKIIIRRKSKREGKYVKDEQYYKAKMLNPNTSAADSEKYYKLMKKVMGNK